MKDLSATKLITTGQIFNASDLANGNLLFESQARKNVGSASLGQPSVKETNLYQFILTRFLAQNSNLHLETKQPGNITLHWPMYRGKLYRTIRFI
ncbi:MAG: hypothetical protein WKF59_21175 [Chitinophagaceae bacterium]